MNFELKQQFQIQSARFLPNLPSSHPCSQMHGNTFTITLSLKGPLDAKLGWVMDYNEIKQKAWAVLKDVDHKTLNDVPELKNPTTENLTYWLYTQLSKTMPQVSQITVSEMAGSECIFPAN